MRSARPTGSAHPDRWYNPAPRHGVDVLYFAYDANIDPDRITGLAPGATFEFIAHLPEWKMEFSNLNLDI